VYNEEANVQEVATGLLRVLPIVADRWELIIVDDGSYDRTRELVEALARREPDVRILRHETNRGYGAAVRTGLAAARYDLVFFTDGDRQFAPEQLSRLVAELWRADLVVGYRQGRADHVLRRIYTRVWNALVRVTFDVGVRDVNCAFKLMRREALEDLELHARGAMVSAELLGLAQRRGYRVIEVPVDHFPRQFGVASGGKPRVIARALVELVQLLSVHGRSARRRVPYPERPRQENVGRPPNPDPARTT
jgi:glycosyltransferase involved in cell wall biosynthesis